MDASVATLLSDYQTVRIPAGTTLFTQGQECQAGMVVLSGRVKVFTRNEEGRELVLYRIKSGETCVLTTSCLLGNEHYPAEAITESDVEAKALPKSDYFDLLNQNAPFRQFVFANFGQRLASLMKQFSEIALDSVEQRLSRYLHNAADENGEIFSTHENIAIEIGSAREVVSRHLKTMERNGILKLSRGKITLVQQANDYMNINGIDARE